MTASCARETPKDHPICRAKGEECISYQLPAFQLDGKCFAWFRAAKEHCAIYGVVGINRCLKATFLASPHCGTTKLLYPWAPTL
jgi:hypothetical protein